MKTITEIIKETYLKGGNDAQNYGLWKITSEEQAIKYAAEVVNKNDLLPDVSNRRELYFEFMKEYNALMGESEHQILKEEVEVLLAQMNANGGNIKIN